MTTGHFSQDSSQLSCITQDRGRTRNVWENSTSQDGEYDGDGEREEDIVDSKNAQEVAQFLKWEYGKESRKKCKRNKKRHENILIDWSFTRDYAHNNRKSYCN